MRENEYLVYKVKHRDTLASIARRVSMDPLDLQEYHNSRCDRGQKIWFNNLNEVKEVIIPITHLTSKQLYEKQCEERPSGSIKHTFYRDKYQVVEKLVMEEVSRVNLEYGLEINFLTRDKDVMTLHRKNVTKNKQKLYTKMEDLATRCADSIYPISFELNTYGKPKAIYQHALLVEKFEKEKKKIEELYIGRVANTYIRNMSAVVGDRDKLFSKWRDTLLYQVLFPEVGWFYNNRGFINYFATGLNGVLTEFDCVVEFEEVNRNWRKTIVKGKNTGIVFYGDMGFNKVELYLAYITDRESKELQKVDVDIKVYRDNTVYSQYNINIK